MQRKAFTQKSKGLNCDEILGSLQRGQRVQYLPVCCNEAGEDEVFDQPRDWPYLPGTFHNGFKVVGNYAVTELNVDVWLKHPICQEV